MTLEQFSLLVGIGLILGQILLVGGFFVYCISASFRQWIGALMTKRCWIILALMIVLGSIIGSLLYSNIYHLEVCLYCWYQRMALYPQAIIFAVALWKREYITAIFSSIILSIGALLLGLYHYALNLNTLFNPEALLIPCDPSGISCAAVPIQIFGYITIPFMTVVVALMLLAVLSLALRTTKK